MSKAKINQRTKERCLLTEITPYETPTLFSNWGSYNYILRLSETQQPTYLKKLFSCGSASVPFKYRISKDGVSTRTLSLVHPNSSYDIVAFYTKYDIAIIRACRRSPLSLRAPHHIAKFYTDGKGVEVEDKQVEDITEQTAHASSYFAYSRFSHLHKFFESDDFTELEKRYSQMRHLDISKFFPSLYTHSISWAARGKIRTKNQRFGGDKKNAKISSAIAAGAIWPVGLSRDARHTDRAGVVPHFLRGNFAENRFDIDREAKRKGIRDGKGIVVLSLY